MPSLGYLPNRTVTDTLDGTTTSLDTGPFWLGPDGISRIALHSEFNADTGTSQNLVTTSAYYGSNDERHRGSHPDNANAQWDDISAQIASATAIDASSGAGDGSNTIDNLNYEFFRIVVTRSSGDGDYTLRVGGRQG